MKSNKLSNEIEHETAENVSPRPGPESQVFGRKVGWIARLIGCSHRNVSRPFVEGGIAYKSCLQCGARKPFDIETFESRGTFYYPPVSQQP